MEGLLWAWTGCCWHGRGVVGMNMQGAVAWKGCCGHRQGAVGMEGVLWAWTGCC